MDLRRLRYFAAVAENLSFRKAAEALKTSQPSLSQQIRALERDVGVELLERNTRTVRLTNAGAEYLAGVRTVIAEFEATGQRARAAKEGRGGVLRVGSVGMALMDQLPRIVQTYRERFPDVDVNLTIARSPALTAAVRRESLDLAFSSSTVESDSELKIEPMWSFPSHAVLPSTHPAASKRRLRLAELNGETLIVNPRRPEGGGANANVMAICREQNFLPGAIREVPEVSELESLLGLVACGLGITVLASPFAQLRWPGVVFVELVGFSRALDIFACTRQGNTSPLVAQFLDVARHGDTKRARIPHAATWSRRS